MNTQAAQKTRRHGRPKKSGLELVHDFWNAPTEAFFGQETIASVTSSAIKTLECNRWRKTGIPFRKVGGRVLYRKSDVVNYLESHQLISSTSEYKPEG